jgi:hypothetical protein
MANQNPDGKLNYWYEGVSCTLIKSTPEAPIGALNYWYNGSPQGFLLDSAITAKGRNFAVLIGF